MITQTYEEQLAELKEIQSKNQKISDGALRFNLQLENFQENYKKIIEQADQKFDTHNIEELEAKYNLYLEENQQQVLAAKKISAEKGNELLTKSEAMKKINQGL
jgi:hypothetical protein